MSPATNKSFSSCLEPSDIKDYLQKFFSLLCNVLLPSALEVVIKVFEARIIFRLNESSIYSSSVFEERKLSLNAVFLNLHRLNIM